METLKVSKDHPWYNQLLGYWMRNRYPRHFDLNGYSWMRVIDNDEVYFVAEQPEQSIDYRYGSNAFRNR